MQKAKIVVFSIVAVVAYGIVHDQITVRLCLEYFTVAHPPLFPTRSPTLLAVCWGTVATVWAGMAAGSLLALVSQSDNFPPVPLARLYRGILTLLAMMALCAAVVGWVGYELAGHGVIALPSPLAPWIPADRRDRFMAAWFAHNTSYLVGFGGAGTWIFRLWRERGSPRVLSPLPRTRWAMARALTLVAIIVGIVCHRLALYR